MPETLPNYYIDPVSLKALLALRAGHMASFYLYCDGAGGKAGLSAVRATSAASLTATERGKEQRKQMGVSQFARGILFCSGPEKYTFVRYGGNLAKARMEYIVGVMRKRGGFDGRIVKALRHPALVWQPGNEHHAHWTAERQVAAAERRGYGPVLDARYMTDRAGNYYLDLPGGEASLASAGYSNVYLLSDPDETEQTFGVIETKTSQLKYKAKRTSWPSAWRASWAAASNLVT